MSRAALPGKVNSRISAFPHLAVSITAESDAFAIATVANWLNVQGWRSDLGEYLPGADKADEQHFVSYPQFEIDIDCDAAETLTSPALYAVRLAPVTLADDDFTASGATLTATSHAFLTGDGPVRLTTTNTLPAGLSTNTDYYIEKTGANTFELYTSREDAIAAGGGIVTTDGGTGTHTLVDVQGSANKDNDTRRCRHTFVGDLNEGNTITLAAQTSYMERINHSPLDLYYVLLATSGTGAQTTTVTVTPVMAVEA